MHRRPTLSVVIPAWNSWTVLKNCLSSLQALQNEGFAEIIVVDNCSNDGTAEKVGTLFPGVIVVRNEANLGFAAANNRGYKVASGRYIAFLNSDTIVPNETFPRLCGWMDTHPGVGVVSPKILGPDGSLQESAFKVPTLLNSIADLFFIRNHRVSRRYPTYSKTLEAGWVSGACLVARREAVERIGGWDETFFLYSEEVDFCMRIRRAGYRVIFHPECWVVHLGGQSTQPVRELAIRQLYASRLLLRLKHWGRARASLYAVVAAVNLLARAVVFSTLASLGHYQTGVMKAQRYWRLSWLHLSVIPRVILFSQPSIILAAFQTSPFSF